jgi:eukaryotic-like serine/threonine-protein kinase
MTANPDWDRVKTLFHAAVDIAPEARLAFVKAQADDPRVLEEVLSLLQAYPAAGGFLSTPPDGAQVRSVLARLHAGDQLGPFRIASLIGAGGMGEVYRATDTRLDREVAIKVLPHASAVDAAGREGFEREARAISKLTHPRISTLYDVGSAPLGGISVQYLVMELVDGETLAARLTRGPLSIDQALAVAIEIADALAAAHAAGVVHRDIKPANIMLTRSARSCSTSAWRVCGIRWSALHPRRWRTISRPGRAPFSERCRTWRRSNCAARRSIRAPICSRSARCSTRC